ncbi:ATP-binding protein [Thalassotalea fonticola]|uniref:histidine kinase n=1 Tax=Thalassotalea fonticola TaxID=3065649 RepID=A0ABZ0GJP6_9GAMM|nr:ATP-binding protein [Colwelliaceae bacterium S1-1]
MIKFSTLSARLTLWYSLAYALLIGGIFAIFFVAFNSILSARLDEDLVEDIEEFQQILQVEGLAGLKSEIAREAMEEGASDSEFIRMLDYQGNNLFSTNLSKWPSLKTDPKLLEQAKAADKPVLYIYEDDDIDEDIRALYGVINQDYIVHIGESLEANEELNELFLVLIVALFFIGMPMALFVGFLMSKKAVSGINKISRIANDIDVHELDKRVSGEMWGDEIQQLANTFNTMLDRISDLVQEMKALTDNVAHDLRSPLARIRVIAETSLSQLSTIEEHKDASADIIEECDRLIHMINATLDLAEMEAGAATINMTAVNFSKLINDACDLFQPLAEEKLITIKMNIIESCYVTGDEEKLQRMLANLLDNAIKYTDKNGQINVELSNGGSHINLLVKDSGIGIPEEEQGKIFERFYRCDQSRLQRGCGLGLSFARAVVKTHGGKIEVESIRGQGSCFRVLLQANPI